MLQTANAEACFPSFGLIRGTSVGLDQWSGSMQARRTSLGTDTPLETIAQWLGWEVRRPYSEASLDRAPEIQALSFSAEVIACLISKDLPHIVSAKPPLSFQELARLMAMRLSISKTDLATRVFRVSRPTVYNWIAGSEPDDSKSQEHLRILGSIAHEISRKTPRPLYRRFVYEALPGETKSIIELLEGEYWDQALLRGLFLRARELTALRDERLGIHARLSSEGEDANYHDNLLSLGGE